MCVCESFAFDCYLIVQKPDEDGLVISHIFFRDGPPNKYGNTKKLFHLHIQSDKMDPLSEKNDFNYY